MNRRDFLRRAAIVATGAIAADQLELLERLTHRRRFFPAADVSPFGRSTAEDVITAQDQHGRTWTGIITRVDAERRTIDVDFRGGFHPSINSSDTIFGSSVDGFRVGDLIGGYR